LHERLATAREGAERVERASHVGVGHAQGLRHAASQPRRGRLEQVHHALRRQGASALVLFCPVEQVGKCRPADGVEACDELRAVGLVEQALSRGPEGHALTARAHGGEQTGRRVGHEHQRRLRRRLFEQVQQRVLGLDVEPLGVRDHRGASPSLAAAQAQRVLQRPDLADAHARVVRSALHPEQVGVVAHVSQQRSAAPPAVETDLLTGLGARTGRARFAGSWGAATDRAAHEAQGRLAWSRPGAGDQVRGVEAPALQRAVEQRGRFGGRRGHGARSLPRLSTVE
jgi:hypothetical protein